MYLSEVIFKMCTYRFLLLIMPRVGLEIASPICVPLAWNAHVGDLMNADGVGEFAPEHIAGGAIREDFVSPLVSSSNDVSAEASADDAGSDNDDGTIAFPSAASTTAASPLSTRASSAPPASSRPTGTKVGAGTATPIVGLSVDNSELSTDRHEHSSDTGGLSEGKEQESNDSGQTGGQESKPPRRSSNFSLFGGGSAGLWARILIRALCSVL